MAIAEVIKFEGPHDALVWKFPIEDFNATSQLIVDETHEALLVVNGNAADLFTVNYEAFKNYYNRTHMPKGKKFKFF